MATVKGSAGVVQNLILQALQNILAALGGGSTGVTIAKAPGAANFATGQVATSASAGTLLAARATRRSVIVKNLDTSIIVYIGPATVTAGNGMQLLPGQSIPVETTALIQVIAASGTPTVAYSEVYD